MNAPAKTAHLEQPNVELLPLTAIAPSETHIQAERRKHYNAQALEDLAATIRDSGVLQPIVVRPLAALRGLAKYELVAGERRWLAAAKAEQAHILARIVTLSDAQVLKAQLVENLQREGLDTLAEAAGYRELLAGGVNADAIAAMIGKSRSYVYARVKLLELAPAVQGALEKGEIDASQALLFARIPTAKLQEQGLNTLRKWDYQGHGERLSFRRTAEILGEKAKGLLIPLAQVPWRLDDDSFYTFGPKDSRGNQDVVPLPACAQCPKRSGNDPELLAAIEDANVCTDKACHELKGKQTFERRRKDAEAAGKEVLTGEAAAAIAPTMYGTRGYVDLDEECDDDRYPEPQPKRQKGESQDDFSKRLDDWWEKENGWRHRSYRQLLGDDVAKLELVFVQDPKNKSRLREMAPDKEVAKLLKAKGIEARVHRDTRKPEKPPKPVDPEKAARQAEKEARERAEAELEDKVANETRLRLLKATFEKWKGPLDRDELELLVTHIVDGGGWPDSLDVLYPKGMSDAKAATLSERDLGRFLIMHAICSEIDDYNANDRALTAFAKRLKLDPKATEKEVRAELAPKSEASAPAKKKPPAKKKAGKK